MGDLNVRKDRGEQWQWPYGSPTTQGVNTVSLSTQTAGSGEDYANEVEVERGEHDATLRFYRNRGDSRRHVRTITVPLGVLEWLEGKAA